MNTLKLPKNRYSSIYFLMESFPNWYELDGIFLDKSAYDRIKDSSFITRTDYQDFVETFMDGTTTPPLIYNLKQIKFDTWRVLSIEVKGKEYVFTKRLTGGNSVYVSC